MLCRTAAVEITLEDESAAVMNEQAVKAGNVCGGPTDRIESDLLWRRNPRQSK
jgi:hypothetical protein